MHDNHHDGDEHHTSLEPGCAAFHTATREEIESKAHGHGSFVCANELLAAEKWHEAYDLLWCVGEHCPMVQPIDVPGTTPVDGESGLWTVQSYTDLTSLVPGAAVTFKYTDAHDVMAFPDQAAYEACDFSNAVLLGAASAGGGDEGFSLVVTETTYVGCSKPGHCQNGQKIKLGVWTEEQCLSEMNQLLGFATRKMPEANLTRAREYYATALALDDDNCGARGYLVESFIQEDDESAAGDVLAELCAHSACGPDSDAAQIVLARFSGEKGWSAPAECASAASTAALGDGAISAASPASARPLAPAGVMWRVVGGMLLVFITARSP